MKLVLCLDAFGTLFKPKAPVAQQYAQVARQFGLRFSEKKLQSSLLAAIRAESTRNPNYGQATGLGATKWWTNVIHETFTPILDDQIIPPDLAPTLLHRFSSSQAYESEPNVITSLKAFKHQGFRRRFDRVVIGVVTNSDDRVPAILSSLGLHVSPLRHGSEPSDPPAPPSCQFDIDFVCMSYDVGVEKPDSRIFYAAEKLAQMNGGAHWQRVYVGDEYAKDVVGARNAGWDPVLLDPEGEYETSLLEDGGLVTARSIPDIFTWLARPQ